MSETKLKFLLSQEWLSFKDIHDIFTYKDFTIDYRDTAETLSKCFDKKEINLYVKLSKFHDYESFFEDKGYKQNIYLSHNNRVISKWYKKDFFEKYYINDGFLKYDNKLFKKDSFRNKFHNLYLKILKGGITYNKLSNNRKAGFTIEQFMIDDLEISFIILTKGDDYRYREPIPDIYSTADENLAIYMKKMEFIEHFSNILDLEPYIKRIDNNNSYNKYDNYISQIVNKIKCVNTADIKLTLNQEYISYKDLSLIYGELIDIEKLSSIAFNNSKLKFYFQINEDKLAIHFLGNKDEAFLNDVLKGVSTFDDWIHYVVIVEPFLEYDNDSFNGYIRAINIRLENGYRTVSKGTFDSIFIDRLLFKKDEIIEYLSLIGILPKDNKIKNNIEIMTEKENNQPNPATNQDDSYIYSEALKPYNDIILAFRSYIEEANNKEANNKEANNKEDIEKLEVRNWLTINHKDKMKNNKFTDVLADLIFLEYGLVPKTGRYANLPQKK